MEDSGSLKFLIPSRVKLCYTGLNYRANTGCPVSWNLDIEGLHITHRVDPMSKFFVICRGIGRFFSQCFRGVLTNLLDGRQERKNEKSICVS